MTPLDAFALLLCAIAAEPPGAAGMPMAVDYENTAEHRWLAKKVHASRLLDDMEDLADWQQRSTFGYTEPSPIQGQMTLTTERFQDGRHSIRLRSKTKGDRRGPQMGRPFGNTSVIRRFAGEDWSDYNRLSFWVYPDLPGFHTVSLLVALSNEGQIKLPGPARLGLNFLDLKNHSWNHVLWEIPDLPRDKVTGVEFQYRLQGNEPEATDTVTFDIDRLELQRVDADYYEGWAVAPGRIAYCHTGYQNGSPKAAIASGLDAAEFDLVDQDSGKAVLAKKVKTVETPLGEYQVMDFSELRRTGTYILRAGRQSTQPFRISPDVWSPAVWKAINYFYCQRCGVAVPGIHDVCHQDWQGVHGDKTIIINGGWHDAGDLSQGLTNTCEAIGALLGLAEQLRLQGREPALAGRLVEESRWGLEWLLKNNFGGGYRIAWATHDFWTNGKIGDVDDVFAKAANGPRENFTAAAAETIAYRVLRDADPDFANRCLATAKEDWRFAAEVLEKSANDQQAEVIAAGTSPLDVAAVGVLASVELFQATGENRYAELAAKLARTVVDCQQRTYLPGLNQPLAGFFHVSPAKKKIYHSDHRGHDHAAIMALAALCRALPDHADWIEWYSAVVYYSEYLKAMAAYTEPYGVLPASLYRDDEYLDIPETPPRKSASQAEATREGFREQVQNGVPLGGGYYLRRFPVWFMRRGHFGVLLTQTKALSTAAQLRGDPEAAELAERQLQWIVGCNPFSQSTMYGEGHDYVPHYSAMSGQIVGSLPVGIETLLNHDAPYWPVHNHMNPKETWVYPVAHWLSVMQDLARPLPAAERIATTHTVEGRHVTIQATVQGKGVHDLAIRADNVHFDEPQRRLEMADGQPRVVTWQGTIESVDAPWVAVVVPDQDVSELSEVAAAGELDRGVYPQVRLSGGGVELVVYLPDAERGINRGTRFDRSGFVGRATYRGHTWFGTWQEMDDPTRHDNVMGTAGEFGMGTNGMPAPLGFDEAKQNESFLKIGVGILRKQGDNYRFADRYDIARTGDWNVERELSAIEFRQELSSEGGYGYRYVKRIAVSDQPPGFTVEYELQNTGTKPIDQTYYAHNFVKIDDQAIGPDYRLTFPTALTPDRDLKGIAAVAGGVLTFDRNLKTGESVFAQFQEHDLPAAANGVLIENTRTDAAIRITGDRPISRCHFWATDQVACPEPFVTVRVEPVRLFGGEIPTN